MKVVSWAIVLTVLTSCTQSNKAELEIGNVEKISSSELSPYNSNPEMLLLNATLKLPEAFKGAVKKSDLVIWMLSDSEGAVVAGNVVSLPEFPWHLKVKIKDLNQAISPQTRFQLSARIVHFGEESMPPREGQLSVMLGAITQEPEAPIGKAGIKPKTLEKIMKKMEEQLKSVQDLKVGDSVEGNFRKI